MYIRNLFIFMKKDSSILGFFIGLFLPFVGVVLVYFIRYSQYGFKEFFSSVISDHKAAAIVLSLSLLINLLPFWYFNGKKIEQTTKGILIATMLYFVLFILLKFVW